MRLNHNPVKCSSDSCLTLWIHVAPSRLRDDINRYAAYFLFLPIYHLSTWTLHRLNRSPHYRKLSEAHVGASSQWGSLSRVRGFHPARRPSLVMDDLWGMMNRLLSGPQHILIRDSAVRREERHCRPVLYCKIQLVSPEARWLLQ